MNKDIIDFPTQFSIKVVGKADADLENIIVTAINNNKIDVERTTMSTRDSSAGKYISFTVTFHVENKEQLDNLYRELSGNPQVLMVL